MATAAPLFDMRLEYGQEAGSWTEGVSCRFSGHREVDGALTAVLIDRIVVNHVEIHCPAVSSLIIGLI